ncbi:MAG: GTP-binding protein [Alphaproteobacteria bacterium]|jgi:GTP-binding protein
MFTVALIGRPNVGKSTLFNRLIGKKTAIVDNRPGVTRDRREGICLFDDFSIRIFDTAGYEDEKGASLESRMRQQTEIAVREADLCLFITDARDGLTPMDGLLARFLRKSGANILLVTNKAEGSASQSAFSEMERLGFGEPLAISAEHGENILYLLQSIIKRMDHKENFKNDSDTVKQAIEQYTPEEVEQAAETGRDLVWRDSEGSVRVGYDRPLRVSVIGRPNAGKSTLINHILGEERLLTGPEAGITRDSIAVDVTMNNRLIRLFDTAGIRKKSNVVQKIEKLSVADTLHAVQYSEVVIVLLDLEAAFEKQDLKIVEHVAKEGRAIVIAVNKWDLCEDPATTTQILREKCTRLLPQIKGVPIVFISGLSGRGIPKLFDAVFEIYEHWNGRIPTAKLNVWLERMTSAHPAPLVQGRRLKLKFMTQAKARPPTFIAFTTRPDSLPDSYRRYLINGIRHDFDFPGTPIRFELRKRHNPYANKKKNFKI